MARVPAVLLITCVMNWREASTCELMESAKKVERAAGQRYNFTAQAIPGTIRTLDKTGIKDWRTIDLYFQCDCQQCRGRWSKPWCKLALMCYTVMACLQLLVHYLTNHACSCYTVLNYLISFWIIKRWSVSYSMTVCSGCGVLERTTRNSGVRMMKMKCLM